MDSEIREIIEEINRHCHDSSDESVDDVLAAGLGLVRLFGYRDRKRHIDIKGRLSMSQKVYPEYGLTPGYKWAKRLMRIAMDDKIADPKYRDVLPKGRNNLEQCARMTLARFEQGIKPDPQQRREIAIHQSSSYLDLKAYREQDPKNIVPLKQRQLVMVIIPRDPAECDDSVIGDVRQAAHDIGCHFAIAEVRSKKYKEAIFEDGSVKETLWTISMSKIEKAPKRDEDL